jgi:hypothetical protein
MATDPKDIERLSMYTERDHYVAHVSGKFRTLLDLLIECPSLRMDTHVCFGRWLG